MTTGRKTAVTKRREEARRCDKQQQWHVETANNMTSRPLTMTTVTTTTKCQDEALRQDERQRRHVKPMTSTSRPTMKQWEEARRLDKQQRQLIEIADSVNIKTNDDEDNDDDDEVAGGGTVSG
jgi:hypothetical protein